MADCTDEDKKQFYQLQTTVMGIQQDIRDHGRRHDAMESRVTGNENNYIPAAKQAIEARNMVEDLKIGEAEVKAELTAHGEMLGELIARNLRKDESDEDFKDLLFKRLQKIETFVAVNKVLAGIFVLIGLPVLSWMISNDLDSTKIEPAHKQDKIVKVKKAIKKEGD